MNTLQKRFLLFLGGCIPSRILLAYIAYIASPTVLTYMAYLALLPAFGFFYLFLSGKRKTGSEVFGDKIWWNWLRPVHGLIYLLFAVSVLIYKYKSAYLILALDAALGLISFLVFHGIRGDFQKVFQ